jgi:hypothetical protein
MVITQNKETEKLLLYKIEKSKWLFYKIEKSK